MEILGGITSLASDIIDKLFPDKDEAKKAKLKLMQMQQDGELKALETQMSAILAEAKSSDPWTSRARPMFMYVFYVMILFSIPMGIISAFDPAIAGQIADGMNQYLGAIPQGLWVTFGIGYTGYATARSYDKKKITELFKGTQ